jgi:outer membrane murein-binding lipoprotein Lpp
MRLRAAVVAVLLLAGCGNGGGRPVASPAPAALSAADWSADLDALVAGVEAVHPNPYWREPRADFRRRVDTLRRTLPAMSIADARIALVELAALLDGHTMVYPTDLGFSFYALKLYEFADGVHVLAAPSRPEAVGARLVAVGATPVADVLARLRPLISYDNDQTILDRRPLNLVNSESLVAKGVVRDLAHPAFHIRTRDGRDLTLDPPLVSWDGYRRGVGSFPVGLPHRADPIWWAEVAPGVLHVQYNVVQRGVDDAAAAIRAFARRPAFRRVVVDVRHNGGGDNNTYDPLLAALRDPLVNRDGRLVVLIGRATFSAAANFVTEVERTTRTAFVGEPTGGRPNLYGDVSDVVLPHSGIVVHVSSRYWQKSTAADRRPAIAPDVAVPLTARDFFAGRDPVLDAAVAYRPR